MVDAGGAAGVVGDETGEAKGDAVVGAEEFDAHEGAGEGGVGGTGKDGDESEGGKEGDGFLKKEAEAVTKGGTNVKQGGNFAAFESAAQGDGGEEGFPKPRPCVGTVGLER